MATVVRLMVQLFRQIINYYCYERPSEVWITGISPEWIRLQNWQCEAPCILRELVLLRMRRILFSFREETNKGGGFVKISDEIMHEPHQFQEIKL
jgi:hypothetical protein